MKKIASKDVLDALQNNFDLVLKLKEGFYYQNDEKTLSQIYWCDKPIYDSYLIDMVSIGIPIIELGKKANLLPGILDLILDIEILRVNDESTLKKITMGHDILIEKKNTYLMIVDKFERKMSFGKVTNGKFENFTDVGWYIREGD